MPFLFFSFDNVDELKTSDINYCFKENLDYVTFGIHLSFVFGLEEAISADGHTHEQPLLFWDLVRCVSFYLILYLRWPW